jgi:hypothetical protein
VNFHLGWNRPARCSFKDLRFDPLFAGPVRPWQR